MASNLEAMPSNLRAMASNLIFHLGSQKWRRCTSVQVTSLGVHLGLAVHAASFCWGFSPRRCCSFGASAASAEELVREQKAPDPERIACTPVPTIDLAPKKPKPAGQIRILRRMEQRSVRSSHQKLKPPKRRQAAHRHAPGLLRLAGLTRPHAPVRIGFTERGFGVPVLVPFTVFVFGK